MHKCKKKIGIILPEYENPDDYLVFFGRLYKDYEILDKYSPISSYVGLLCLGNRDFPIPEDIPLALSQSKKTDIPVLGIGWGMEMLNLAYGGKHEPQKNIRGDTQNSFYTKRRVFLSPGGKVSFIIGGSGWVTVPTNNNEGIPNHLLASDFFVSAYAQDRTAQAIEKSGHNWVIGVQWPLCELSDLPSGFDNLLIAFIEQSTGVTVIESVE